MSLSGTKLAWAAVGVAAAACAVLYGFIFVDAWRRDEWIHVMTLTPLMPFLVVIGLAYRHRHSVGRGLALVAYAALLAAVFLPVFWRHFTPDAPHVVKALVKGALPIGATAATVLVGALLELHLRRQKGHSAGSAPPDPQKFAKY